MSKLYTYEDLSLSSGAGFERSGSNLTGWNTQADGTGTSYSLSASVTPSNRLTELFAVWATSSPAPYSGPQITGLKDPSKSYAAGESATFTGERLAGITSVFIDSKQAQLIDASNNEFTIELPAGLTPGSYDLYIQSSLGNLTYKDALAITGIGSATVCANEAMSWWTKRMSETEVKIYIKCPELNAKIRLLHQTGGSGPYESVYVKTITDIDDPVMVINEFGKYIVRTIELEEINRIRIRIDDVELWKVRYNNYPGFVFTNSASGFELLLRRFASIFS